MIQLMPNFWLMIYLFNTMNLMILFINNYYMTNLKKL